MKRRYDFDPIDRLIRKDLNKSRIVKVKIEKPKRLGMDSTYQTISDSTNDLIKFIKCPSEKSPKKSQ